MSEASTTPQLSVVLPACNEVMLLGSTVTNLSTGLFARGLDFEIIVVENGSVDGTGELALTLAAELSFVRALHNERGDYGAALVSGFEAARAPIVACFDVDYYDLAFLDAALERLAAGADIVFASKRVPGARDERPLYRRILTAGLSIALRQMLGLRLSDAHGMKVYRRAALESIVAACTMRSVMFDAEMALRAERNGLRIAEVPARVSERRPARTSVLRRTLETVVGLVVLRSRLRAEEASSAAQVDPELGQGDVAARRGPAE